MKNRFIVAMAMFAVAGLAANAMANGVVNTSSGPWSFLGSGGVVGGGGFRITPTQGFSGMVGGPGGDASSFISFCVERNESLGTPQFFDIQTSSSGGGLGGGSPDQLSPVTAAIYQHFRNGGTNMFGIAGFTMSSGLPATLNANNTSIQLAIWHLENELDATADNTVYALNANAVAIVAWGVANNNGTLGDVRVLRMWDNADLTGNGQDQLTLIPLPPAGWAGLGSLAGVAAFGAIRRRKLAAV